MPKIDFKKSLQPYYQPIEKGLHLVEVPVFKFIMIDGHGDPNQEPAYQQAVETLFGVAYKIKFASKDKGRDYVVPPLQGLWWAEDMANFTTARNKNAWDWTMMLMIPDWISPEMVDEAKHAFRSKSGDSEALQKLRFESYHEGLAVQVLHVGSYEDEAPVLEKMHKEWIPENGFIENGKHHEIYLNDPRRVESHKLKTILRQPVRKIDRNDELLEI